MSGEVEQDRSPHGPGSKGAHIESNRRWIGKLLGSELHHVASQTDSAPGEFSISQVSKHFMRLETQGQHLAPVKLGCPWACYLKAVLPSPAQSYEESTQALTSHDAPSSSLPRSGHLPFLALAIPLLHNSPFPSKPRGLIP